MLGQDRLHLRRHHVGAAADDLVHAPGGQEQVTVRIDVADVAPKALLLSLRRCARSRPCLFLATDRLRHVQRCHVEDDEERFPQREVEGQRQRGCLNGPAQLQVLSVVDLAA
jgi:hypothetical protein